MAELTVSRTFEFLAEYGVLDSIRLLILTELENRIDRKKHKAYQFIGTVSSYATYLQI